MADDERGRSQVSRVPTGRRVLRPIVLVGAGLVALLVLVAVGFVVHAQSTRASSGVTRWDDFRRPDGPLASPAGRVLPSGQRWQIGFASGPGYGGPGQLRIAQHRLRFDGPGAAYAWTTGDTAPTAASVDFGFEPGPSPEPRSSVGLIISRERGTRPIGPNGVASVSVHAGFGVDSWSIGIADGSSLQIIAAGRYRLDADGATPYRATLRLTGPDTVEIDTPDGETRSVTDDRIPRFWGPTVLIEHFQPIAGFRDDPRPIVSCYAVEGATG